MLGQSMMELHSSYCEPRVHVTTDASGLCGYRASWLDRRMQCPWTGAWSDHSVAAHEMLPIVLASAVWGPYFVRVCLIIATRC